MPEKTHKSALVLIPPEEVAGPIQEVRLARDRHFRRWMPHVTLLYPFRPQADFEALAGDLRDALRAVEPFEVELGEIRWFRRRRDCVLWLSPRPAEALQELQEAVWRVAPECDEVRSFKGGFTPHLSIGQAPPKEVKEVARGLEGDWLPIRFRAERVSLIFRQDPPDDVFGVERTIPLGAGG